MIELEKVFKFAEWVGKNYFKLHRCWVVNYADQRDSKNYRTTAELWEIFIKSDD